MNLLNETVRILKESKLEPRDVIWVGDYQCSCSWEEFAEIAKNINYDNSYGGHEINLGLLVVGTDFWLERHEYDGSEWWEFKRLPTKPAAHGIPKIEDAS